MGDLVVGGTLLDVKTVVRLGDDPERAARWVWQLLAYAWIDTVDRYRLHGGAVPGPACATDHLAR